MKNYRIRKKKFKAQKLQPVLFLLPAAIIVVLVTVMLPFTVPTLKDIPERLSIGPVITEAAPKEEKPASVCMNYKDGVYTGSAYGYGGEIRVKVTVKDGYIVTVDILEAPGETEPYFSLAKTVMDRVYDSQTWEVDTVTGATFSSRGILAAIENAITGRIVETERPDTTAPVADTEVFKEPSAYKDGTYTGTAQGFGGPVTVQVVIRNGKIVSVEVVSADGETPEYLSRAKAVTKTIVSSGTPNVDVVSGATYSSTAIITAVKRALAKAGGKPAPAKEKTPKPKNKKGNKIYGKQADEKPYRYQGKDRQAVGRRQLNQSIRQRDYRRRLRGTRHPYHRKG